VVRQFAIAICIALAMPMLSACVALPSAVVPSEALRQGPHEAHLNGARIWYEVAGTWDGRSAPVVYLAGGPGGNSYTFSRIAGPPLEQHQLMIYYDQRGTGRSERPESGDYELSTLVGDIEALRVHLGVPKIALIAHSFGAILALEYGAAHPDRLAAAVLAGPLWSAPLSCREQAARVAERHPEVYRAMMAPGEPADGEICDRVFRAFPGAERERFNEENMFPNRAVLDLLNRTDAESGLRNTGELSRAVFKKGLLQYEFRDESRVTAPVLVVGGGLDFAAGPRTQRLLAERLPRGHYLEYQEFGHWMFLEDPERFARDASAFLRSAAR
jgi:proline iminopeptidase